MLQAREVMQHSTQATTVSMVAANITRHHVTAIFNKLKLLVSCLLITCKTQVASLIICMEDSHIHIPRVSTPLTRSCAKLLNFCAPARDYGPLEYGYNSNDYNQWATANPTCQFLVEFDSRTSCVNYHFLAVGRKELNDSHNLTIVDFL